MANMFRTLKADEIECRISTVTPSGLSLLLYKDARCDMAVLDESDAVGPMKWRREHSRDNKNCTVSIWSDDLNQWVSKEDTGTESFTEKEKGLASDSFKRACFNWGIGRELYSAPFIWIHKDDLKKHFPKKDKNGNVETKYGKEVYTCADHFKVTNIHYDENRVIDGLAIQNTTTNKRVYLIKPETEAAKAAKAKVKQQ